jgi:hypothetical protein
MKPKTSKFLTELSVIKLATGKWELGGPLNYQSVKCGAIVDVPAGFVTDFASVPRLPFAYLLVGNIAHRPAVVHDFLYQTHWTSKRKADHIFLEAMKTVGIAWWRREIMYLAVKYFGRSSYRSGPKRYKNIDGKK